MKHTAEDVLKLPANTVNVFLSGYHREPCYDCFLYSNDITREWWLAIVEYTVDNGDLVQGRCVLTFTQYDFPAIYSGTSVILDMIRHVERNTNVCSDYLYNMIRHVTMDNSTRIDDVVCDHKIERITLPRIKQQ